MKRSQINTLIREAEAFLAEHRFLLPVWAHWSPKKLAEAREATTEIRRNMLGWDLTDFGSGEFLRRGLLLFTIRNGNPQHDTKPYAEKIMVVREGQETPMHFHWSKMEDIINRGGGRLVLELYPATRDEALGSGPLSVSIDGIRMTVPAGGRVTLEPGQSICLEQRMYHRFWGEGGSVLVGEVSMVNDDSTDNRFLESIGRFPAIVEDEPPYRLLVCDYAGLDAPSSR